jgi:spore coat protein U-like protein
MMIKKYGIGLTVVAALLSASGASLAATATTSIAVSARVSKACSISTVGGGIAFGEYDPIGTNATAALYASGSVSVTCSRGSTGVTIGMDMGKQPVADQRQMKGAAGATLLKYNIFQPPSSAPGVACTVPGTIAWTNTGAGLLTLDTAPTKDARSYNVCGVVPGGQDVTVEAYSDTVTATLNF